MSITVRLNDGVELHIGDRDYARLLEAFQTALDEKKVLEVHNSEGLRLLINPTQVLYFAQSPNDPSRPEEEGEVTLRVATNGNGQTGNVNGRILAGEPVAGPRSSS